MTRQAVLRDGDKVRLRVVLPKEAGTLPVGTPGEIVKSADHETFIRIFQVRFRRPGLPPMELRMRGEWIRHRSLTSVRR